MPSVWYWTSYAELIAYGISLILAAFAYCGAHTGVPVVSVVIRLVGFHVGLGCTF